MKCRALLLSAVVWPLMAGPAFGQAVSDREQAIVVTGMPLADTIHDVATPVSIISGDELVHRRQATLGESLTSEPGINADTFGGGASRPVIRGQTSPRVRILSDGSELQDASAVSPDHAVTTEPLLLKGIEILRGPSALVYGGGAIGGAVNLIDEKVPTHVPSRGIAGVAEVRLGSADDEATAVGGITTGKGNFAFRAEGVYRRSDDYRVPDFDDQHVNGSYNDSSTVSVGGSWIGRDGYLGAAYTRQRSEYGLPGHDHEHDDCHPHGASLHCGGHDHAEDDHDHEGEEAALLPPFVKLRADRFDVRGEYRAPFAGVERVRFRAGVTDYKHDELERPGAHGHDEGGEDEHAGAGEAFVATTFKNKARDARLEVEHVSIGGLKGLVGIQTSKSDFSAQGEEAYLADSRTRNTGIFLFERLELGKFSLEFAGRQEWQKIETTLDRSATHAPTSISGAAIWKPFSDYSVALSFARSQRAPTAQELFADGVHLATNTFELGDAELEEETSKAIDLTLRKTRGATTFTVGVFLNDVDGYIFADTLDRFEDFRLIRYSQADARFVGVDGEIVHRFGPGFGVTVFGDYVRAKLQDEGGNLPRIPAGRLGARLEVGSGPLHADVEYYRVFEQSRIAEFETRTPGYNMVNMTVAYELPPSAPIKGELFLRGTNLLNELALNHASFIKDAAPLRGRNFVLGLRTSL